MENNNTTTYQLINPYDLLGFDSKNPNISMKELKSSYFTLSLICHPDKGGNKEDMVILQNAYLYVKAQIELKDNNSKDYKIVENEFKEFMKEQSSDPPPFSVVYEESHVWLKEFNDKFEESKQQKDVKNTIYERLLLDEDGYGSMMESTNNHSFDHLDNLKNQRDNEIKETIKHQFENQITTYKEPQTLNHYTSNGICNINSSGLKVNDFTTNVGNLNLSDYKKAFTSAPDDIKLETLVIEKKNDDIDSILNKLLLEREEFDNNIKNISVESFTNETKSKINKNL